VTEKTTQAGVFLRKKRKKAFRGEYFSVHHYLHSKVVCIMREVAQLLLDPAILSYGILTVFLFMLIIMAVLIRQAVLLSRLDKKYRRLLGRAPEGNLEEILLSLHGEMAGIKAGQSRADANQMALFEKAKTSLRGMSLVRYNAFQNTGSDLSFSLAFLDENRDGVVLSTIYGREESRTYAKPVQGGSSTYHLSAEEEKALRQAEENMKKSKGGAAFG
jgi:hypothetical protein